LLIYVIEPQVEVSKLIGEELLERNLLASRCSSVSIPTQGLGTPLRAPIIIPN